jgi:hypothetical protein
MASVPSPFVPWEFFLKSGISKFQLQLLTQMNERTLKNNKKKHNCLAVKLMC